MNRAIPTPLSTQMKNALVWAIEISDRDGRNPAFYLGPGRPIPRATVQALIDRGMATGSTLPTRAVVPLTADGITEARRIIAEREGD